MHRFGLVLAGGAAKGAYQVGAAECLAHLDIRVTAIAGTSIGALNGVTLAAAPSLQEGSSRLVELWTAFTHKVCEGPMGMGDADTESLVEHFGNLAPRVLRLLTARGELEQLADRAIDAEALRTGTTMRVAVYPVLPPLRLPHLKAAQAATEWLAGMVGLRSRILHLNGLDQSAIKEAVLGSAALPFLFKPRKVAGEYYRDGMLGRDNTPIRALADVDHCDIVIVVHLQPGEPIKRLEHPNLTLLQIRPARPLTPAGPFGTVNGLLDFSPANFQRLRQQGYEDTERLLSAAAGLIAAAKAPRVAEEFMSDRVQRVVKKHRLLP
ncbi:patatin-like phospholipase family protein [Streptomyces antarcticus]|uniref:patatin-like phospholipase family protein n=1 Tax=Streptomyces antarcticus TaxID=2996458 RepID=UPI00226D5535|nr:MULTISPECIES: patatin-like phospholipase family protein [unclassified Streptomyces]MCY0947077.1 patatin-like phospholipase family protein [Streptomyces sp. H34-AA3]MCZ4084010.1 patatin-like phospholipase family protein [Streptomyces sp. H34-S5]